jgi:hypothetical protein
MDIEANRCEKLGREYYFRNPDYMEIEADIYGINSW